MLGQYATDVKSNEITAIPELLKLLDIEGAVVSIDAMGCQKSIANTIRQRGAEYVFGLKSTRPHCRPWRARSMPSTASEHGAPATRARTGADPPLSTELLHLWMRRPWGSATSVSAAARDGDDVGGSRRAPSAGLGQRPSASRHARGFHA